MPSVLTTRLHELTVVLYAFSVLLYFFDFIHHYRKAKQIAFWLLAFVWILQTIFLFIYIVRTGRFPVLTIFEGLYFYAWLLITLSLMINYFLKVDFIVFFTNILGFVVLAIHTFAPMQYDSYVLAKQLVSELLLIHITMAILSYGALSLSGVFSLLYLVQYNLLKRKKWGARLLRLADLEKLERLSYIFAIIGVPMLLLGLILGLQWAFLKLPGMRWYDMKIIGSFVLLTAYSIYLYRKTVKNESGRKLALWNVASFLLVLINFFLLGRLSSFHLWYS